MPNQNVTSENELQLLEALESSPDTTQAELADQVGVAVGTVNWYLKRWSKKGYVKISRMGRWNWQYLLTSEGVARKARLANEYVEASMKLYRRTRLDAQRLLGEIRAAGYTKVYVDGGGEIAEIFRLTCLEKQVDWLEQETGNQPVIRIDGTRFSVIWPREENDGG